MPTRRSGQIANPGAFGSMYQTQAPGSRPTTWGTGPNGELMGYNRRTGMAVPIAGATPEVSPDMNPIGLSGLLGSSVPMPPERPAGLGGPSWSDYAPGYNTANTTGQSPNMLADAVAQGQVGGQGFWSTGPGWGDTALAAEAPFGKPNAIAPSMASAGIPEAFAGYPTERSFEKNFPGLLSWSPYVSPEWGAVPSEFDTNYWGTPQMASTGDLSQLPQVPTPPVRPFDLGVKPKVNAVPHIDAAVPAAGIVGADMPSVQASMVSNSKSAYGTPGNPMSQRDLNSFGLGDATPAQLAAARAQSGLGDAGQSGWGQTAMGIGGGLLGGLAAGPVGALAGGLAGRYAGGLLGLGATPNVGITNGGGAAYGTPGNPMSQRDLNSFGLGDAVASNNGGGYNSGAYGPGGGLW